MMSRALWMCMRLKGSGRLVQSKSRATVAQIAKKVNASADWKVSKYYHLHPAKHFWDVQDKHFQARAHLQGSSGFLSSMAWCCGRRSWAKASYVSYVSYKSYVLFQHYVTWLWAHNILMMKYKDKGCCTTQNLPSSLPLYLVSTLGPAFFCPLQ